MKILHVEDRDSLARAYKARIQEKCPQIEILRAATYDEAVELLEKETFDLIVSDFSFPGKEIYRYSGGIDLYRLILDRYPHMTVHFLSSMAGSIEEVLAESKMRLRPTDKIFYKGSERGVFEAFGQEYGS